MRRSTRPVWLSPDAPADVAPRPYLDKPVTALGIAPAVAKALGALGVRTVADLGAWEAASEANTLVSIKGLGPGTLDKITRARVAWHTGA